LIGREHKAARGYDYIEGAVCERKVLCVSFLPGQVVISFFRGPPLSDCKQFGCKVDSRDGSASRTRHECCISGSARNVEHLLAGADAGAPHDMVGDGSYALGYLVVFSGRPCRSVFLFQLSEVCHYAPPFVKSCLALTNEIYLQNDC
jgi:hypothetical protein